MKTYTWIAVATTTVLLLALVAAATQVSIVSTKAQNMTGGGEAAAQNQTETTSMTATNFTAQKTAISTVDALLYHQTHQVVVVLPKRTDGKIWVGTLSWSASKPVEVRLLQNYDANIKPDEAHGKPVTAPFDQGESAISLLLQSNGAGTVPSGVVSTSPYNAGSMNFVASQVAFHTQGGVPFTVTYAVDAEAKSLTM